MTLRFFSLWKVFRITPVQKDGLKNNNENYRPISLLPKVSIVERIPFDYIVSNAKYRLNPKQFVYQTKRGALLQLFDCLETIHLQQYGVLFDSLLCTSTLLTLFIKCFTMF